MKRWRVVTAATEFRKGIVEADTEDEAREKALEADTEFVCIEDLTVEDVEEITKRRRASSGRS